MTAPPPPPAAADASASVPSDSSKRANLQGTGATEEAVPFSDQPPAENRAETPLARLPAAAGQWHRQPGVTLRGVRRSSPTGTPVEGFSWLAELLPYIDQQPLYNRLNFGQPVTSRANLQVAATLVPEFLNPLDDRQLEGLSVRGAGATHFAGMSGVEDARNVVAATLPRSDPRAGVFGYDEVARPKEITDGASQTIMLVGTGSLANPWILGGGGTVRGGLREPLFDQTSGLGTKGLTGGGTLAVMVDGSVRQVTAAVDPRVFKAMCTTHGAESVDIERSAPSFALENLKTARHTRASERIASLRSRYK